MAGLIGHVLNDLLTSGTVWWGWALGSGITAAFMGLIYVSKGFDPLNGLYTRKHIGLFVVYGIVGLALSLLFSGWFDIAFMGEPLTKEITQVTAAFISNVIVFLVLGVPAVIGYAKRNAKVSNLSVNK
ncbi:substrate-specific component MtsA of methionine-regulated ECF transporter [Paenibacillus pini JCM 16418]|uniref:Substrate-specific component MtsA of methionine-regulated ECF transporter n=1 Tax=Paenibacillus pini JCM 16418 TaxID=1236976 RepID=W7YGY8_9BACL|nr:substrate-specific component MtsA of methionine-regulated ECF transporter [Paenibacillus pini JCM 16418]